MKRTILTIKQIDYTSKDEFEKDIPKMREQGYRLIENEFNNNFTHGDIIGDTWTYTAYFSKETL